MYTPRTITVKITIFVMETLVSTLMIMVCLLKAHAAVFLKAASVYFIVLLLLYCCFTVKAMAVSESE